ncbi:MAG: DUF481 domain-containing protein, partial [Thermoanaerobaculia bacterium]|nr:DUF481 domain-containing protein [Thermoanaerobaculia bacterium]
MLGATLAAAVTGPALAQRTDVVLLRNGNKITGEVKSLDRGRLKFKTDDLGTIYIEWDGVDSVTATDNFEIETRIGLLFYGSLAAGDQPGDVGVIAADDEKLQFDHDDVVRISPIKASFWGRLDGSFDLGFSLTQANNYTQYWASLEATRTRPRSELSFDLDSSFSDQNDAETIERHTANIRRQRNWRGRRMTFFTGQLDSNEELGIRLRGFAGAGVAWKVVNTNRAILNLYSGLGGNREDPVEDDAS